MQEIQTNLTARDGHNIPLIKWVPDGNIRACVHIVHGMAEHSQRYRHVAKALTSNGYAVSAHDLRGHGRSIKSPNKGHFGNKNGWELTLGDLTSIQKNIKSLHPKKSLMLLGHSMGSFICQDYIIQHGENIDAVVLSGSNYSTPLAMSLVKQIARFECWRGGANADSAIIKALGFDSYARSIKPRRSEFDWLSCDPNSVDSYLLDPLCGFSCTNRLWYDLLSALARIFARKEQARIRKTLPIRIIGGLKDPISKGAGLENLASSFKTAGIMDVSTMIYPNGRHEMFNETNKNEVLTDLVAWFDLQSQIYSS